MPIKENNTGINSNSSPMFYMCNVCEWVYDGSEDFNNLPVEYICIKCGAAKVNFKPFLKNIK
jgi:rubredoxin